MRSVVRRTQRLDGLREWTCNAPESGSGAPEIAVKLYHFTSREHADDIARRGFNGTSCWLSPDRETICGETARSALIEVVLTVTEDELLAFEQSVAEEVWDEGRDEFVPDSAITGYLWYEVPTQIVADRGTLRIVPLPERQRLLQGRTG